MGMSGAYGPSDEGESIATIHAALDQGVNLIDTGDFYGTGHNEMLVRRALIVPVIGARTRSQLAALQVRLSPAELAQVEEAVPASAVAGTRYGEQQMKILDSEG